MEQITVSRALDGRPRGHVSTPFITRQWPGNVQT